jgi:predicted acyl esterase
MTVDQNIPIKMNDGVTLIANVGYPSDVSTGQRASGTFPVLLTQDPYASATQPNSYYVTRGYINAVVEVRGTVDTYGPGGKEIASPFFGPRQTQDGVALVKWAAHTLSRSNGVIGLDGCSFLGIDQIFTAAAVGPNSPIKEILPACASNDYNNYFAGGIPSQVAGLFNAPVAQSLEGTKNEAVNHAQSDALEKQFVSGGPDAYNNSFWQERTTFNVIPDIVKNGIPALLWSGWYPTDGPGSLIEYAIFQNAYAHRNPYGPMTPRQRTTGRYQIIVGPWMHGQGLDEAIELEWYDTWLKHETTGLTTTTTPMHLFTLQSKQWVNASTYPMTDDYTAMHLGENSNLTPASPNTGSATLTWGQPTAKGSELTFNTNPITTQEVIGGPIAATVYARSSNRNVELIGTLNDVTPSGEITPISTGTILGSLRAVDHARSWYEKHDLITLPYHPYSTNRYALPGSLQRYDITLTPSLYAISPDDHLQFVLTTQAPSDKCASLLSALTTPLPCLLSTPQKRTVPGGVYQILWGSSHPSSVNVPFLSEGTLHPTTSGVTPTSSSQNEPLNWSSR